MKHRILPYFAALVLFTACEKTDFDDPSTLTNEEAVSIIKSFSYSLVTSSVQTVFNTTTSTAGVHFSLLADQTTNTNGNSNWWYYAQEPRMRIINSSSERSYSASLNALYSSFYQANLDATKVIDIIENQGGKAYDDAGKDRTSDCLIGAYYAKGVAQGYLGNLYDRGIIVDDINQTEKGYPNSYKELTLNGVKHLEKAIELAQGASALQFDFLRGVVISKDDFLKLANSIAARILSSVARDKEEATELGSTYWQKVLAFAEKGFSSDFLITTSSGGYYNALLNNLNFKGNSNRPVDVKVPYLADNTHTYPNYYPTDATILGPITTDDDRFYQYFSYTPNFGILMESRGRGLFSNYIRERWTNSSNSLAEVGSINPYFLSEEIRLLKAEAHLWLHDYTSAAALLNEAGAARKSAGHLGDVAATEDAIRQALHYEYAIEIDAAGGVTVPFTFMRRNDLLIGGTPTEYPIPQKQLELIGEDLYTFGGKEYIGERGIFGEVATAFDKGWKASE